MIEFLNVVFGSDNSSHDWWKKELPEYLELYFSIKAFPFVDRSKASLDYRAEIFGLNDGSSRSGREFLFRRIVKLTGLRFSKEAFKKFQGQVKWNFKEPLELLDLVEMGDRVKDMDIVSSSQGNFFQYKSLQETDKSIAMQMLLQVYIYIYISLNSLYTDFSFL